MIFPDWLAPPAVRALCTTRADAESDIPASLALPDLEMPLIRQVHGNRVVRAEEVGEHCEADAIISRRPGLGCRIVTADCLPLLLCNRAGTEVAAVHAGWRGLAAGVIEATLEAMVTPASGLLAWIGPAISQRHYEVGRDVYEALATDPDSRACFAPRGEKFMADLPAMGRLRLRRRGVTEVAGGMLCTYGDAARFHSWRRDGGAAGRQVSVICMSSDEFGGQFT
jgi:YfiH family protein